MCLTTSLFGHSFTFGSIKEVLAKANEEKSGDKLAGIAAETTQERVAAKVVLSELTLADLRENPVVPYEQDEVTRVIDDGLDKTAYARICGMTVAEFRDTLLMSDAAWSEQIRGGLTAEMAAAVTKLMGNLDLVYAAQKLEVRATCNTTIGGCGILASRLQPNHTTDSVAGIMASLKEGLSYGVGDALIGLNPVGDSVDNVCRILDAFYDFTQKWRIPTQNCVLSHITTQMEAMRKGAPMDLMFQSIAGSECSNRAFGIDIQLLDEGYAQMRERYGSKDCMYFETGQGSELSSNGHFGADQVTMEARCYGLARRYHPFLVNTVVGFIGPEYLYDAKQVIRAGLEDHFMGKLMGLPMGCDACYTNHMKADQNDIDNLLLLLANAGCNYFIGVPCSDDIMLMYQSTGFHDIAAARAVTGKHPIRAFERRMEELGILKDGDLAERAGDPSVFADGGR
ncbi:ethanolamine ammonia-lyase subunit EutB [Ethanoligenens sp.]|uniref:ethanolamine ammonia-lyase subunit EutB n=1 Tax=Ethanoligenens sp. TaxID=2099655 RepID=UPI0039EC36A5